MSHATAVPFPKLCKMFGIPEPTPEYCFHPTRKWRFDYAWVSQKVALEVEGGIWIRGRHSRGKGMLADMSKYNAGTALGWRIFRCTPDTLHTEYMRDLLIEALK